MNIKIKIVREGARVPVYASDGAAAADLYACCDAVIPAGGRAMIPSGIAAEIPAGFVGVLCGRSGLARKNGIAPANGIGVIDSDYRGEICAVLSNSSGEDFIVTAGDRIAQLMIMPVERAAFEVVGELDETARGEGGFGSTGVR